MDNADHFLRLAVALAIGLLVGVERGWHQRDDQDRRAAGIRTFALSGLIGGIAGIAGQELGGLFAGFALLAFAAVLLAFEWREAVEMRSLGATTAVAGLAVFLLGVLAAVGDMAAAVAGGITTAALLAFREVLHGFVARLDWVEVRDGLILLAMAFLLLPLLPDRALDPWGALNPHALWIIATLLAAMSYAGWMAIRALGERWGTIVTASVGGLASSTATTVTLARLGQQGDAAPRLLAAGMCLSGVVALARVAGLALVLNPALASRLALPFLAAALGLAVSAFLLLRQRLDENSPKGFHLKSPLDLLAALKIVLLIAAVSLVAALLRDQFGDAGLYLVAATSGIVDLDAITITAARLTLPSDTAGTAILLATAVNLLSKATLAGSIGGAAIGRAFWPATVLAILAGAAASVI